MLDDPLRRFAIPSQRDRAFFLLPRHQSRQRGRKLTRIGHNQLVRHDPDGLGTLGVVMQRENWLIAQVCLVYLDEPDEPTHDTRRG